MNNNTKTLRFHYKVPKGLVTKQPAVLIYGLEGLCGLTDGSVWYSSRCYSLHFKD